jgi:predicted N-acetyltransferase YhbS
MLGDIELEPGELETDAVLVRQLALEDLDAVVRIDEIATGQARRDFYRARIVRSMEDSSINLSLAAEVDGHLVGFLGVSFYSGEFGQTGTVAVLDTIGVHPEFRGQRVAQALMRQLEMNLTGLRVPVLRTEVAWDQFELLAFFHAAGFVPAQRLSLEKTL